MGLSGRIGRGRPVGLAVAEHVVDDADAAARKADQGDFVSLLVLAQTAPQNRRPAPLGDHEPCRIRNLFVRSSPAAGKTTIAWAWKAPRGWVRVPVIRLRSAAAVIADDSVGLLVFFWALPRHSPGSYQDVDSSVSRALLHEVAPARRLDRGRTLTTTTALVPPAVLREQIEQKSATRLMSCPGHTDFGPHGQD